MLNSCDRPFSLFAKENFVSKKVIIIGGGYTGMACATRLKKLGVDVVLLEKKDSLGGLAGGFREPQWQTSLEYYYHHWFKSDAFYDNMSK